LGSGLGFRLGVRQGEATRLGHVLAAGAVAQPHGVGRNRRVDARPAEDERARAARVDELERDRGGITPRAAVIGAEGGREAEEAVHLGARVRPFADALPIRAVTDASEAASQAANGAVEADREHVAVAVGGVGVVGVVGGEADDRRRREAAQRAAHHGGDVGDG